MSRDKQIEEMAKIPESEMGMSGYSKFSWKLWEKGICNMSQAERADQIMREMGYRKASEVAREIFEEIEKAHEDCIWIDPSTNIGYLKHHPFELKVAELKKKYTKEITEEGK